MPRIYRALHVASGRSYIGQTVKALQIRKNEHHSAAKRKGKDHCYFAAAISKYGREAFEWETLVECEAQQLDDYERLAIVMYNSLRPGGFNLTSGGRCEAREPTNKRRDIDGSVLPKGIELVVKNGEVRGYRGYYSITGKSRKIIARRLSMPVKLEMAKAWLAAKRAGTAVPHIPVHNRLSQRSIGLPKHVHYKEKKRKSGVRRGYEVIDRSGPAKRYKCFFSKPTLEENLKDAELFAAELLKGSSVI